MNSRLHSGTPSPEKYKKVNLQCENAVKKRMRSLLQVTSQASVRSPCSFDMDRRGGGDDADSEPDRSNPPWKVRPVEAKEESFESFETAPEEPPVNLWEEIMEEYEDKRLEFQNLVELSKPYEPPIPICSKLSATQYLEKHIFPLLFPALEETLHRAKEFDCLMVQKCRFNGLDYIAELLWNRNPLYPSRRDSHRDIFDIPFAVIWLYYNPRPIYPLSWLWSKEEAITVMQTYIRRYIVCKQEDCSEMRRFWKTIKTEREKEAEVRRSQSIENLNVLFNYIFDKLVADAVYEAEWKIYGCRCVRKPCHCVCRCMKWCKCCNCYKVPVHDAAPCDCSRLDSNRDK